MEKKEEILAKFGKKFTFDQAVEWAKKEYFARQEELEKGAATTDNYDNLLLEKKTIFQKHLDSEEEPDGHFEWLKKTIQDLEEITSALKESGEVYYDLTVRDGVNVLETDGSPEDSDLEVNEYEFYIYATAKFPYSKKRAESEIETQLGLEKMVKNTILSKMFNANSRYYHLNLCTPLSLWKENKIDFADFVDTVLAPPSC